MLNRATSDPVIPTTFAVSVVLAPVIRHRRRRQAPTLGAPLALFPLVIPGTPGQATTRLVFPRAAIRTRVEATRRRPRSSFVYPPTLIVGSTLLVSRSVAAPAAFGGAVVNPAPVRIVSPPWRFVVTFVDPTASAANGWAGKSGKNGKVLATLDRLALNREITFELDMPTQITGEIATDAYLPQVEDNQPVVAEGNRMIYAFRRDGRPGGLTDGYPGSGYSPWVCRAAGLLLQVNDVSSGGGHQNPNEQPRAAFVAFDPWQYLFSRPVVLADGTPLGRDGLSSRNASQFPSPKAGDLILELLRRTIHYHGPVWIDAGATYGGTSYYGSTGASLGATDDMDITFAQGTTVGEAWKQICDMNTVDIALRPLYDPVNRPGFLAELAIHRQLGVPREDAVMAWDLAPRSLLGIDRLEDGTQRANIAQFFTQGGAPVYPPAEDGLPTYGLDHPVPHTLTQTLFGEYWAQKTLTGQSSVNAASSIIIALMAAEVAIRRYRSTTIRLSPAPARAPIPLTEYNLGDFLPIYASKRLRKPIPAAPYGADPANQYPRGRVYKIPIVLGDNGVETVQQLEFSADALEL